MQKITLPEFKGKLVAIGNSRGLIIPAIFLNDYEVSEEEHWVEVTFKRIEVKQ